MRVKKEVLITDIVIILTASAVVGYIWSQNQKRGQDYAKMEIAFQKDRQILECGEKISSRSFIKHSFDEVKIYLNVSTKRTGSHTITYVLTCEGQMKKIPYTAEVRDVRKSTIKLEESHIALEYGQKYGIADDIESVHNPTDGPLKEANKKATGSYWVDSKPNVSETGGYTITIYAQGLNRSSAEKKFMMTVGKKKEPELKERNPSSSDGASSSQTEGLEAASVELHYINRVLLVSKEHTLPQNYGGMDSNAYAALQQLQAGAEAAGHSMPLISGYRSYAYQASLYNGYVARDGQELADTCSAGLGHSEHRSGLAFDIGTLDSGYGNTPGGKWLSAHYAGYGFILHYLASKESITGYQYKPWHVHYVGKEIASRIISQGIMLEEYLGDV